MARQYYGFGIIPECDSCSTPKAWSHYDDSIKKLALMYLFNEITPICLEENCLCNEVYSNKIANSLLRGLQSLSFMEILKKADETEIMLEIATVPMFNDLFDATTGMIKYLATVDETSYLEAGTHFTTPINKIEARRKYGEIHAKLAAQFGFVDLSLSKQPRTISITPLGMQCGMLSKKEMDAIIPVLAFRIPIIRYLFKKASINPISIRATLSELGMKESTINRRGSSIKALLHIYESTKSEEVHKRLSNIYW